MSQLVFGKYEIQHRLAIGGMGEVFYGIQRGVAGFERPVILKSLLQELADQPGFIDQFLAEARVAATLNHPNVVSIYEVGQWAGTWFIAMEYIRGRNLAQLARRAFELKVSIPPAIAAQVVRDAALGLHHAHTATDAAGEPLHIVHRDVSPQNIMVRDDGVTKVLDFGIARATTSAAHTAAGMVRGKVAYMAPEQVRDEPLTGAADQFALGVVLWELLTNERLFGGTSADDVMAKICEAAIPAPSTFKPVSPELERAVLRMLERDPLRRFHDCAEAAAALTQAIASTASPRDVPLTAFMRSLGTTDLDASAKPQGPFVVTLKPPQAVEAPPDAAQSDPRPYTAERMLAQDGALVGKAPEVSLPPEEDAQVELSRAPVARSSRKQSHDAGRVSLSPGQVQQLKGKHVELPPEGLPPLKLPPAVERGLAQHDQSRAPRRSLTPLLAIAAVALAVGVVWRLTASPASTVPPRAALDEVQAPDAGIDPELDPETGMRRHLQDVKMAPLAMEPEPPRLFLDSVPSGASVFVNGKPVGQTPWGGDGPLDGVKLLVTRPGYAPWVAELDAGIGISTTVRLVPTR